MRFLCARRPPLFKGSPLLEAAADEVLSGADVSAIGRGGRRVALGSSVHGAPGSARGGRDVQKWPPRAGAGPMGARGRPASCSAPPSPTLASCPALTSALQAGSGGAGVALGLGGGPPPMSSGHAPGASASSLDTLSQGGLALCVWRAVCHLSTTRGPFSEEGVMGGCWWPRRIWLSLPVAPGRVGAAQVTGLRSGHCGSGPTLSRVLRTEAWSGGSALSKKRLISGLQTERPVASGWVTT